LCNDLLSCLAKGNPITAHNETIKQEHEMERREFLKFAGAGLGSAVLLTGLSHQLAALPMEAIFQGRHFRGYRNDGDIFISEDDGETWQLHTRLGPSGLYGLSIPIVSF
jgi:hypothetical protein